LRPAILDTQYAVQFSGRDGKAHAFSRRR